MKKDIASIGVRGRVRLIRRDRATGRLISDSGFSDNTFTAAGLADVASLIAGGTEYWTGQNLVLGINGQTSADDDQIADSTEDVTGSLTISSGALVMSWLDDRGTGYIIDETDGIELRKGTTASSTELSSFSNFGNSNSAWGSNASGQPEKPTNEDWEFQWQVSISVPDTVANFTSDANMSRSFARRLRGNATGAITVAPTDDVSSVIGYVPTFDTDMSNDHATATGSPTTASGAVVTVRRHRPGNTTNYRMSGERISFGSGSTNAIGFFFGFSLSENTTNRAINYTLTMTLANA